MRPVIVTRDGDGNSNPAILDWYAGSDVAIQVDIISGAPNWTVQQTLQDPNNTAVTPVWYNHDDPNMVAQTVGRQSNYGYCPVAVRVVINSGGGVVRMTLVQHGAPGDR
jgi:hypothetical protein